MHSAGMEQHVALNVSMVLEYSVSEKNFISFNLKKKGVLDLVQSLDNDRRCPAASIANSSTSNIDLAILECRE